MDIIGRPTSKTVYFQEALGYNNGVYLLHDMCKYLYSKPSKGIYARSVSLEDYEREMTEAGVAARDAYIESDSNVQYGHTMTYEGNYSYYPNLYAREIGAGINTEIVKTDGIGVSDKGYSTPTEETYSPKEVPTSDNILTVKQTYYDIPIYETNYGKAGNVLKARDYFWIASRCVCCKSGRAWFGLRHAQEYLGITELCSSGKSGGLNWLGLRPVVHLEPSVQLNLSDKATNASYPHKIIKY